MSEKFEPLTLPVNCASMIEAVRATERAGGPNDVIPMIEYMRANGASILIAWSPVGLWECVWVANGVRFNGVSSHLHQAIASCIERTLVTLVHHNRRAEQKGRDK